MTVNIANPPKALIVLVGLITVAILMGIGSIEQSAGTGLLGSMIGYAVGNGIAAKNGDPVDPIIGKKRD